MAGRMLRATATFALALLLVGCGSPAPTGELVELLTGAMPFDEDECRQDFTVPSMLLVDPEYGTVLAGFLPDQRTPVVSSLLPHKGELSALDRALFDVYGEHAGIAIEAALCAATTGVPVCRVQELRAELAARPDAASRSGGVPV